MKAIIVFHFPGKHHASGVLVFLSHVRTDSKMTSRVRGFS